MIKVKSYTQFNDDWKYDADITGKGRFLRQIRDNASNEKLINMKNRRQEVVIHRLRIGHAGVKDYLHRFGMSESENCDYCHCPETVNHYLMECSAFAAQQRYDAV